MVPACRSAVARALRGARAAGWVPFVVTNGTVAQQERKLRHTGLDREVAGWVISEGAGIRKPDPAIFRLAAAQAGQSLIGRSVRTVALLRYLADPPLRARITAATNKVESYNGFSHWLGFGNNGILASNDPAEQEKQVKLNTLLANLVIFHNAVDIMDVVRKLVAEGWLITAGQLGAMSPYLRPR